MDKLKTVIEEYRNWAGLSTYIDRIETILKLISATHLKMPKLFWKVLEKKSV